MNLYCHCLTIPVARHGTNNGKKQCYGTEDEIGDVCTQLPCSSCREKHPLIRFWTDRLLRALIDILSDDKTRLCVRDNIKISDPANIERPPRALGIRLLLMLEIMSGELPSGELSSRERGPERVQDDVRKE